MFALTQINLLRDMQQYWLDAMYEEWLSGLYQITDFWRITNVNE